MNGAAHRERWVGREGFRTSERLPIVFSILRNCDPPSPLRLTLGHLNPLDVVRGGWVSRYLGQLDDALDDFTTSQLLG